MTCLYVAAGGFIGSILRYIIWCLFKEKRSASLIYNTLGCFALGFTIRGGVSGDFMLFLQSGIIGSFTAFSGMVLDFTEGTQKGEKIKSLIYIFLSLILGYTAFIIGQMI